MEDTHVPSHSSFRVHHFLRGYLAKIDCPCSNSRPGLSIVNSTVRVTHKRSDFSKGRCGQRPCLRDSSRKPASGLFGLPTSGKHVSGTLGVRRCTRSCDPCERDSTSRIHTFGRTSLGPFFSLAFVLLIVRPVVVVVSRYVRLCTSLTLA